MFLLSLKLLSFLACILLALSVAARTLGAAQPFHPVLRGFVEDCDDKPQPCWYGIVPGETTPHQARELLVKHGFMPSSQRFDFAILNTETFVQPDDAAGCQVSLGGRLGVVRVNPINRALTAFSIDCDTLTLGDLMTVLGTPTGVDLCGVVLRYPNSMELIDSNTVLSRLTPFKGGMRVYIHQQRSFVANPRPGDWRGFARCWRYEQYQAGR
jgi:hypothetical protein